MKVELGAAVVLRADEPDIWHLPRPTQQLLNHVDITIDQALQRFVISWPALCDHERGDVFVYDGFVRSRRLCRGCAFLNKGAPILMPESERVEAGQRDQRERLLNESAAA